MISLYKITNIETQKIYVGITSQTVQQRFQKHLVVARNGGGHHLHRAIRKYGPENFVVTTLNTYEEHEAACRAEIATIEFWDLMRKGYNVSPGGEGWQPGPSHPLYDATTYSFYHEEHGEVTCTQWELRTKYNLDKAHLSKVVLKQEKSCQGWRIPEYNLIDNNFNHNRYKFYHQDHGTVECTYFELRKKYNLDQGCLSRLVNGKQRTHKGWRI